MRCRARLPIDLYLLKVNDFDASFGVLADTLNNLTSNYIYIMNFSTSENLRISLLIAFSSAILLAIWPLPETIALRHALLITGFAASFIYLNGRTNIFFRKSAWPLWVFLGFYAWLGIHLIFFSHQFELQFLELRSLWIRAALATILGLTLGLSLTDKNNLPTSKRINLRLGILFLGLCGTGLISLIQYAHIGFLSNQWINFGVLGALYKSKPPFVIAAALICPLCFILIIRALNNQISRWWILASILGIGLSLFSTYFSNTKNGVAIFSIALVIFLVHFAFSIRWNKASTAMIGLTLLTVFSISLSGIEKHIERNSAWPNLIANAQVGLDIDHQNYWKNRNLYPIPTNAIGGHVDISTYERTAWFTAGARLLAENPLGFGLSHHSFGWLALNKWPDFYQPSGNLRGATHSGWMDMALAFGIPGILLILLPLFCAWYRSLHQEGIWFSYTSWTIPIMVFAYLTTEANGEHFTELLFFMTAFFCGLTLQHPRNQRQMT